MSSSLVKDKMLLSGLDEESILQTVAKILKLGSIVRLNIDARTEVVDFWKVSSKDISEEDQAHPFRAVLKQVTMEEYTPDPKESAERQLLSMCEIIEDANYYPVFLLTGMELSQLRKQWISFPRRSTQIAGISIVQEPDITEDVLLLCGARTREAEPIDITFVVKMTLP